jgi:hypothetical protein
MALVVWCCLGSIGGAELSLRRGAFAGIVSNRQ